MLAVTPLGRAPAASSKVPLRAGATTIGFDPAYSSSGARASTAGRRRSFRRRSRARRRPRPGRSRRCRPCRRRSRPRSAADTGPGCSSRRHWGRSLRFRRRRSEMSAAGGQRDLTPPAPKPTISAMPSPFTSASSRGYWSWLVQPPAPMVKAESGAVAGSNPNGPS